MSGTFGVPTKVAVLGGRSEIAAAIVGAFSRHGGAVQVVRCVRGAGTGEVEYDAAGAHAAERALGEASRSMGGLDCVIVAAGVLGSGAETLEDPEAAWNNSAVNYAGAVAAGVGAAQHLKAHGGGVIVYLSSVAAVRVRRAMSLYGSAKLGADAFYRSASTGWAEEGVSCLVVRPGFVRTAMTRGMEPVPFACTADIVGEAVADAVRRRRWGVIYVPGVLRIVAAVMRSLPGSVWRRIRR